HLAPGNLETSPSSGERQARAASAPWPGALVPSAVGRPERGPRLDRPLRGGLGVQFRHPRRIAKERTKEVQIIMKSEVTIEGHRVKITRVLMLPEISYLA